MVYRYSISDNIALRWCSPMLILDVAILFTELLAIFTLLKTRNYLYNKKGYIVGPYENTIALTSFFIGLLGIGIYLNERVLMLLSLPFFVYLIVPVIFFSLKQWKEFLGLLNAYLRR